MGQSPRCLMTLFSEYVFYTYLYGFSKFFSKPHPEITQTNRNNHQTRLEILKRLWLIIFQTIGDNSTKTQNTDPKVPKAAAAEIAKTCPLTVLLTVSVSVETISVIHTRTKREDYFLQRFFPDRPYVQSDAHWKNSNNATLEKFLSSGIPNYDPFFTKSKP